jgi:F420-non-reducing hydrogenase iron-sulfur subunit
MRRFSMLKHTLRAFGMEDDRIRLQWASAAEGARLAAAIDEMVEQVRALGPLNWSQYWTENGDYEGAIEALAEATIKEKEMSQ